MHGPVVLEQTAKKYQLRRSSSSVCRAPKAVGAPNSRVANPLPLAAVPGSPVASGLMVKLPEAVGKFSS